MKTDQPPNISVILPAYNAASFIQESIDSILAQSYPDFELVILDDGSTDNTWNLVESYKDERIRLYQNRENKGLIYTLNKGFQLARGKLIARMDADDISDRHRLQRQFDFMQAHSKIDLCGTQAIIFEPNSQQRLTMPLHNDDIKAELLWGNSIIHATLMIRKSFWDTNQLNFDTQQLHTEDYDLWTRCLDKAIFGNLPEVLYHIRSHPQKVSFKYQTQQIENTKAIYQRQLVQLGIVTQTEDLDFHRACLYGFPIDLLNLKKLSFWLLKLQAQNQLKDIYPEPAFSNLLKQIWQKHTAGNTHLGLPFFKIIQQNDLSVYHQWSFWQKMKFQMKCLLKRK